MKVTSLAVQLLPGWRGDWRLPTHCQLVVTAPAAAGRSRPAASRRTARRVKLVPRWRSRPVRASSAFMAKPFPEQKPDKFTSAVRDFASTIAQPRNRWQLIDLGA